MQYQRRLHQGSSSSKYRIRYIISDSHGSVSVPNLELSNHHHWQTCAIQSQANRQNGVTRARRQHCLNIDEVKHWACQKYHTKRRDNHAPPIRHIFAQMDMTRDIPISQQARGRHHHYKHPHHHSIDEPRVRHILAVTHELRCVVCHPNEGSVEAIGPEGYNQSDTHNFRPVESQHIPHHHARRYHSSSSSSSSWSWSGHYSFLLLLRLLGRL
mmetsp:Transcript_10957/g.20265  ORF Transcript_10957/g.20265 Transcript_10957/m.20265 type:complete len:213 (-) Transcript_10957:745-1383(-)